MREKYEKWSQGVYCTLRLTWYNVCMSFYRYFCTIITLNATAIQFQTIPSISLHVNIISCTFLLTLKAWQCTRHGGRFAPITIGIKDSSLAFEMMACKNGAPCRSCCDGDLGEDTRCWLMSCHDNGCCLSRREARVSLPLPTRWVFAAVCQTAANFEPSTYLTALVIDLEMWAGKGLWFETFVYLSRYVWVRTPLIKKKNK